MNREDPWRIDEHKLVFHPERVGRWLAAGQVWDRARDIYPIYVELAPSGSCNHRCTFCALDYVGYPSQRLPPDVLVDRLREMARLGVRSVLLGGEGEPLLHRNLGGITSGAHEAGLDVALSTNGVHLDAGYREAALEHLAWLKVSVNAGTPETYARVHGTREEDFHRVLHNIAEAVALRNRRGLAVSLGVQALLLEENRKELETLARVCREVLGVDYLVVKPYSQHRASVTRRHEHLDYADVEETAERVRAQANERFRVIFRTRTMARHHRGRTYRTCLAVPFFWAYIASDGDVYSCSSFLGDPRFRLGNIRTQSFREIWEGDRRRHHLEYVQRELNLNDCRKVCRMDAINAYLSELKNPHPHVNFI